MTETMTTPPNTTAASEHQDRTQDANPVSEGAQDQAQNQTGTQNQQNGNPNPQKPQKSRHRASVACASCRDRRIRCVVPSGETSCTQCKRSGVECIIKNDDERRRPISRAYMCSLTERVALLEQMLKERGAEPPPANHPPKTRHGLPRDDDPSPNRSQSNVPETQRRTAQGMQHSLENSSPGSQPSPNDEFLDADHHENGSLHGDHESAGSPSMIPPPKKDGMVSRLLSTRGHLSFDQLSGRLRYFGPTTNCHVHSDLRNPMDGAQEMSSEQSRRAERIIRSLPLETYDYLMDLFWTFYNSVLHVLHQEAFNEDREAGRTQFYSGFLHVCVLAMGYRFADKSRPDIQKISLPQMESTLHREAKYMLDHELERPGGIPSVVALLLLGDLECGVGRDNIGWLYGGLAVRLAFDIGLHLDTRMSGLPEREVEIRQMTLWACVIYDKYWALFLGRPTSMKSSDLEIYSLSKQFERLGTCRPAGPSKSMETLIYEALIDLMELAGKITENMDPRSHQANLDSSINQYQYNGQQYAQNGLYGSNGSGIGSPHQVDRNQYLRMAALDREFSNWYARLPEQLRWTPANIATAPFSFFLLHQQYHASLILLHRPFAMYEDEDNGSQDGSVNGNAHMGQEELAPGGLGGQYHGGADNHFSALSRTVCTKHAIRVARIFWQHRQRFDTRQIFVTGLQHAGTAATALVAALAFLKDPLDRQNNMQYLECLSAALSDMALTYQPAERMSVVLRAVMVELRGGTQPANDFKLYKPKSALVPARRGSTHDNQDMGGQTAFKKRQTSRPRAGMNRRSLSMNTGVSGMGSASMGLSVTTPTLTTHPNLSMGSSMKAPGAVHPSSRAFDTESERSTDGGFILIQPHAGPHSAHSEMAPPWPPSSSLEHHQTSTSHQPTPGLDPSGLTSSTPSSTLSSSAPGRNAWMGAHALGSSDSISQLANVHFPEIPALTGESSSGAGGGSSVAGDLLVGDGSGGAAANLDFLALGEEGAAWGREWLTGAAGGEELDGFGGGGAFGMGVFGERGFGVDLGGC